MIIFTEGELVLLCMRVRQDKERELVRLCCASMSQNYACMHVRKRLWRESVRERRGRLCKVMSENCVVLLHVRVKRESAFCACM